MKSLENPALLAAIALYVFAFGLYLAALIWRSERLNFLASLLVVGGLAAQTISIILRWAALGHPPVFGSFENAVAGSWFVVLFGIVVAARTTWLRSVGLFTAPMAVAIMVFGLTFDRNRMPLTISERSLWIDIHAVFAWLSYSSYTLALIIAILILVKHRQPEGSLASKLPKVAIMDDWLFKYVIYGFVTQAFTITSGAYYEFIVFGRWWRWDPIESVTLASWLLFALFIHLKRSFGWSGRRLAWLVIFSMITVIVAYWLLSYWPGKSTFHLFDVETREHIR